MADNEFEEQEESSSEEAEYERPIECSECKRAVAVRYTEIVGNDLTEVYMCSECPILRHRLHGTPHLEKVGGQEVRETELACGNCGTSLEAIRLGNPLGCSVCYEVFDDIILPELAAAHKIPQRLASTRKLSSAHVGRSLGEVHEISPSLRLLALNEALNEMLKSEDYEQAAWLRDQIKALTDKKAETTDEKPKKEQ
jgi:protein arginine kinase activator